MCRFRIHHEQTYKISFMSINTSITYFRSIVFQSPNNNYSLPIPLLMFSISHSCIEFTLEGFASPITQIKTIPTPTHISNTGTCLAGWCFPFPKHFCAVAVVIFPVVFYYFEEMKKKQTNKKNYRVNRKHLFHKIEILLQVCLCMWNREGVRLYVFVCVSEAYCTGSNRMYRNVPWRTYQTNRIPALQKKDHTNKYMEEVLRSQHSNNDHFQFIFTAKANYSLCFFFIDINYIYSILFSPVQWWSRFICCVLLGSKRENSDEWKYDRSHHKKTRFFHRCS